MCDFPQRLVIVDDDSCNMSGVYSDSDDGEVGTQTNDQNQIDDSMAGTNEDLPANSAPATESGMGPSRIPRKRVNVLNPSAGPSEEKRPRSSGARKPLEKRKKEIGRSIQVEADPIGEEDLTTAYFDFGYFIDINFLLAANIPKSKALSEPLLLTKLRPKEVSILRISGAPHYNHWLINYEKVEGMPNIPDNKYISEIVHGMTWKTKNDDDLEDDFENFLLSLRGAVRNGKLYTMNSLVYHYLKNICRFKHVIKLEKRKIQFDPYIYVCDHHVWTPQTLRCCTTNRVWAMRNSFSAKLTTFF